MSKERWTEVESYITGLVVGQDGVLEAALEAMAEADLPPIQVTPNHGKLLQLLAQLVGASRILEIGTLGGYSTIWLARALPPHGQLITLEAEPSHAAVAQANIERAGLAAVVEVRVGQALDALPLLAIERQGPFDLIFIDADKPNNPHYFAWALKLIRPGGLIVVDNVVRDGALTNPHTDDPKVLGSRRLLELMAAEPRLRATVIQTVGSKGYDGLAIALVGAD